VNRFLPLLMLVLVIGLVVCAYQFDWGERAGSWLDDRVFDFCDWWRERHGVESNLSQAWLITGLLGGALASLICGVISSLVVSNRMAFFSDALAHCAFAGVSLGLILHLLGVITSDSGILATTILFGVLVGALIAYVREKTPLASDTVIGVFFAGAMGLGAVLLKMVSRHGVGGAFSPETFLFGDILAVTGRDIIYLAFLTAVMIAFLCWLYNRMVFASFSPSLARSRNFPVRLGSYLFIILLALIVNVCLKVVGVLLINALLVIPGATAAILARNLRQFFWWSVALSLTAGLGGLAIGASPRFAVKIQGHTYSPASGGVIVVLGVVLFFLAMLISRLVRGPRPAARTGF
jgi:zinc transport system permease protein